MGRKQKVGKKYKLKKWLATIGLAFLLHLVVLLHVISAKISVIAVRNFFLSPE
jgi:hypothetical protein